MSDATTGSGVPTHPPAVRVSIVGGEVPVRVLAVGELVEMSTATLRVRLDPEHELVTAEPTFVAIVHHDPAQLLLVARALGETEPQMVRLARVARAS